MEEKDRNITKNHKKDHGKGQQQPKAPKDLPRGGEEERRGNDDPTYPDLMGPYPERDSTRGTVLGQQEQHTPDAGAAPDHEKKKDQ